MEYRILHPYWYRWINRVKGKVHPYSQKPRRRNDGIISESQSILAKITNGPSGWNWRNKIFVQFQTPHNILTNLIFRLKTRTLLNIHCIIVTTHWENPGDITEWDYQSQYHQQRDSSPARFSHPQRGTQHHFCGILTQSVWSEHSHEETSDKHKLTGGPQNNRCTLQKHQCHKLQRQTQIAPN